MINDKVYQSIFEEIRGYLIQGWDKVVIYLEYGNASYTFAFYIKKGNQYTKCYDLLDVSEDALLKNFSKIDAIVSKERKKENADWSNMTMIVDSSGNMHTDFDYTDLTECSYQYKKIWKKKYLV
ncbi:MAG: DUF600 family protein [Lachnospiraceae bacterium]|nr:DUF600 family protein [Lachnospiraceae bacterium]